MAIRTMNWLLGAVALSLAVVGGSIGADASVRLPAGQMSGMPSLAPLLSQVKAAVVTVAIADHSGPEKNSVPNNGQCRLRSTYTRDVRAGRQTKASGSGVVIDAQEGLIFTNVTSLTVQRKSSLPSPMAMSCLQSVSVLIPVPMSPSSRCKLKI